MNIFHKKRRATKEEVEVMKKYFMQGYEVYRSPMSLFPFDILAANPRIGEILFIEVKHRDAKLSKRQKEFEEIISKSRYWRVKYVVERVENIS